MSQFKMDKMVKYKCLQINFKFYINIKGKY